MYSGVHLLPREGYGEENMGENEDGVGIAEES